MVDMNYIALVTSLALASANASTTAPPATTSSPCLSPGAMWGVQVQWSGGAFGNKYGLASPEQCLEFCNAKRTWGECKAFSFFANGRCLIHNKPASEVARPQADSGYWIWDKECWECGELGPIDEVPTRTTSATTVVETCLSPTAKCEVEARFTGEGDVKSWGRFESGDGPEDGLAGCHELCTDARKPPRCRSFSWDPSTGTCLFYNFTFDQAFTSAPGSGLWAWDIDCWTCGVSGYT
ncbi:hypothetical protein CGCA056_v013517 [Colletotrichum aenigma]|uniref:uncharacterized protein n=1 Tax=Colletotrichum aenigma TaxID=1215731 RepID=UPI001872BC7D|nr:uncharacterized protein CGCA056_v013517 [Colletotrichum aenigma]KAF5507889.1 hypothetical protein CGCA056_v013517 [Colletotrichum aenigma]